MSEEESLGECSVCLGDIQNACNAPCGHAFCRDCILGVFQARSPGWRGFCPLCRRTLSIYTLRDARGAALATPEISTIFGTVFTQAGGQGRVSYHFESEDDCYMCCPSSWRLDDGSPLPAKKQFELMCYEAEARRFRAVVSWFPTLDGAARWEYEIIFADDFSGVVGGHIQLKTPDGEVLRDMPYCAPWEADPHGLVYLRWTPPPSTVFGSVFVQGVLYASFLEGIASYHFNTEEDSYISYSNAPPDWKLDDGSPPPEKKHFSSLAYDAEARVLRVAVDWNPTFHGAARWEYEMRFAEDFSRIVEGTMTVLSATGEIGDGFVFGDPASGRRRHHEMLYVRKPGVLTGGVGLAATLR